MLDQGKLNEGIFFAVGPLTKQLLDQQVDCFRTHIPGYHNCRIVRHIVTTLNEPHHGSSGATHRLLIAGRILPAWVLVEKPVIHLQREKTKWIRLMSIRSEERRVGKECR